MKTLISLAILFLLIAPIALAETNQRLELLSPATGNTINPVELGFQYRVASVTPIKDCSFIVDGQVKKTTPYNDDINGKILNIYTPLEDGTYNWTVSCVTVDGVILTDAARTVTTKTFTSEVTRKSSGLFRGSMAYEFEFTNTVDQAPIVVNKLAAGDFLWILLKVPPSTFKKELYVKRFESVNGKKSMILEDLKGRDTYTIVQGENATINISSTTAIINFVGIELNRANIIVYPSVIKSSTTTVTDSTGTGSEAGSGAGSGTKPDEKPVETVPPTPAKGDENTGTGEAGTADAPKQGVFKRFVSWLTSIFGA